MFVNGDKTRRSRPGLFCRITCCVRATISVKSELYIAYRLLRPPIELINAVTCLATLSLPCKVFLAAHTSGSDLRVRQNYFDSGCTNRKYFTLVCALASTPVRAAAGDSGLKHDAAPTYTWRNCRQGSMIQCNGSVKEPNKFHNYETEKITRKASYEAEYIELFGSSTQDRHTRRWKNWTTRCNRFSGELASVY